MNLSPRLSRIYDLCLPGEPVWDLCCDHGLLGLWALRRDHPAVYFNDAVPHVLEELREKLNGEPRAHILHAKAEDIDLALTGTVTIAGVGGEKIALILRSHASRGTLQARRVVVCPEKDAEWLVEQQLPGLQLISNEEIHHTRGVRRILAYAPI